MTFRTPAGRIQLNRSETDMCWLDCTSPGFLVRCGGYEMFLCEDHRADLTSGHHPRESRATEWPWRRAETQLVDVLEAV